MPSFDPWAATFMPPELDDLALGDCLTLLVRWNVRFLHEVDLPPLYDLDRVVRYRPEAPGHEVWRSIPHILENGGSVCHSLAAWRAAELIVAGIDARPIWDEHDLGDGRRLYHVRVWIPETRFGPGFIDDPSLALGMDDPATQDEMESLWQ